MPCSDGGYDSSSIYVDKINQLTRLLCEVMTKCGPLRGCSQELVDWWDSHQEIDKKRVAAEEAFRQKKLRRQKVLNKLTLEERKLLGLS